MFIDLHFHTKQYSSCSQIDLEEGIQFAKEIGLDGICITDHDCKMDINLAEKLGIKYNILIIVGVEIYTHEGDVLCFGLDEIPKSRLHASELIELVNNNGGATISAHPFRNNNRGLGKHLEEVKGLTGIEVLNGNTLEENNSLAKKYAKKLDVGMVGASDAHRLERIGIYATQFEENIRNEKELVAALKSGKMKAVYRNEHGEFVED